MTRPARFLAGTIIIGIFVLIACAMVLRQNVSNSAPTDPFDAVPAGQTP